MISPVTQLEAGPELWNALLSGSTLPGAWYCDPEIFELEKDKIFARLWQYAGRSELVAEPGDYFVHRAGNVPIVVVRDKEGDLHAFINVCRHRGAEIVLDDCGERSSLQCTYHGWTWGLDGELRGAPRTKEDPAFDRADWPLHKASVETWGPFVFVHASADAPPLRSQLGVLPELLERQSGVDMTKLRYRAQKDYDIQANWKVLVENFNECYHCPVLHPEWTQTVHVDEFELHTRDYVFIQDVTGKETYATEPQDGRENWVVKGTYSYVFPNFMCNTFPGPTNVFMRKLTPLDANRTHVQYEQFCTNDVTDQEAADVTKWPHQIFEEDIPITESVQRGIRSGFFERGHLLLPYHENGPHHFMKLVYLAMTDQLLDDPSRANGVPERTLLVG